MLHWLPSTGAFLGEKGVPQIKKKINRKIIFAPFPSPISWGHPQSDFWIRPWPSGASLLGGSKNGSMERKCIVGPSRGKVSSFLLAIVLFPVYTGKRSEIMKRAVYIGKEHGKKRKWTKNGRTLTTEGARQKIVSQGLNHPSCWLLRPLVKRDDSSPTAKIVYSLNCFLYIGKVLDIYILKVKVSKFLKFLFIFVIVCHRSSSISILNMQ